MHRHRPILVLLICLFALLHGAPAIAAATDDTARVADLCLSAAKRAEQLAAMPEGMVTGIMLAETGRWSKERKRSYPWPWTVTSGTDAWFAASRADAIDVVRHLQAEGRTNIDVGCMQINLHWHPDAFDTIEQALDPVRNIAYGAAFLRELFDEQGSWSRAVAAYHSRDPERGDAYLARVEKLQEQQRYWGKEELQMAFADAKRDRMILPPRAGADMTLDRALLRGGVLLAALEAPAGVETAAAPGSVIKLRRDRAGGQIPLTIPFCSRVRLRHGLRSPSVDLGPVARQLERAGTTSSGNHVMEQSDHEQERGLVSVAPLDRLLSEALQLAEATKLYLENRTRTKSIPMTELVHVREIGRITARLGFIVAWLLACKADRAGELEGMEGREELCRLGGDQSCLEQPAVPEMPGALKCLLEQSAALYGRATRLATTGTVSPTLH